MFNTLFQTLWPRMSRSRSRSRSGERSKSGEPAKSGSDEEEAYEVQEIRDKRRGDDGDYLYYVKWVGASAALRDCMHCTALHSLYSEKLG